MGLRVNNNVTALRALLNLNKTDKEQASSLERLSTGLRIIRASDDPSGLVISESLRAQLVALKRAASNTQNGSNLLSIADNALGKVSDLLRGMKDSVTFALNSGGITPDQLQAQQESIDNAISAIDRISKTTRYADRELLNGSSGFAISNQSQQINDVLIKQAVFSQGQTSLTLNFEPIQSARRAQFNATSFTPLNTDETADITVTGPKGAGTIRVTGGSSGSGPAADTMATFLTKIQRLNANLPAAFRATNFVAPAVGNTANITITGPLGSATITLDNTDTLATLATKIAAKSSDTGVTAVNSGGVTDIYTTSTGSNKNITITVSETSTAGSITLVDFQRYGPEINTSGAYVTSVLDLTTLNDSDTVSGFDALTGVNAYTDSNGNNVIATEDLGADVGIFLSRTGGTATAGSVNLTNILPDGTSGSTTAFSFTSTGTTQIGVAGSDGVGNPLRAAINITQTGPLSNDVTLSVTGPRGSAEVVLPTGATNTQIAEAINRFAGSTGAFAIKTGIDTTNGAEVFKLLSEDFGSSQSVQIKVVSGSITLNGATKSAGDIVTASGTDAKIKLAALQFTASGRQFIINTPFFIGSFSVSPDVTISHSDVPTSFDAGINGATVSLSTSFTLPGRVMMPIAPNPIPGGSTATNPLNLTLANSGLTFQIGTKAQPTDRITFGIPDVTAAQLGSEPIQDPITFHVNGTSSTKMISDVNSTNTDTILHTALKGGLLTSLQSGNPNDLDTNPSNAAAIVDAAIARVSTIRGFLGAIISQNLEPAKESLDVSIQNVAATESSIRDLNFAEETANFTRTQILFQAGIAVLASANLVPQSVLALLR